jgi:SpoVK/Ycf46/Vps4 family AAA+-type ATPase
VRVLVSEQGYSNSWEHIYDEFRRIDTKIYIRLLMQQGGDVNQAMDPFKGLVVSEEEVLKLLTYDESTNTSREDIRLLVDQLHLLEEDIANKLRWSEEHGIILPIVHLSRVFKLTPFEEQALFLCLAVELDRKYEKLYAFIQDDVTCKYPTADLAMKLICQSEIERYHAYASFTSRSTLNRFFLHNDEATDKKSSLLARVLKLEERIVHYITNPTQPYDEIQSFCQIIQPGDAKDQFILGFDIQQRLHKFAELQKNAIYYLWGTEGAGKRLHIKHLCESFNSQLILVDVRNMLNEGTSFESLLNIVDREARMLGAVIAFTHFEAILDESAHKPSFYALLQYLADGDRSVYVLSDRHWIPPEQLRQCTFIEMEITGPTETERLDIWEAFSQPYVLDSSVHLNLMAGKFQFTAGQIKNVLSSAYENAIWKTGKETIGYTELHTACSKQAQHRLAEKAVRIKPRYGWEDIILPIDQKELLHNACNQMKHRHRVHGEWGFGQKLAYGKGLSMLFSGPPGTGKTMSAQVVAADLQLELYKIDLSQVISKYIGETEKNLHEIFREAKLSGSILFFDESDALFGKRSEVKEANDKYANVETAYLLQKMEEYDGITILATNLLQNIDDAFLRRINFVIRFPFPDYDYRQLLWRSAYPKDTPLDHGIDYAFLARKLQMAGGNIKNIAMSSAFLAAEKDEVVGMKHILIAAKHELQKSGRILPKEEMGIYEDLVN